MRRRCLAARVCYAAMTSLRPANFSTSSQRRAEAATDAPVSAKVAPIVDQISGLSLLEVSELVQALKVCSSARAG